MATKRTSKTRIKPTEESPRTPESPPFQQIVASQMELWRKWNAKVGTDIDEVTIEVSPIVSEYWTKMLEELWRSVATMQTSDDPIAVQEDLRRRTMSSYNEMMKKIFTTKSFAARSGSSVTSLLDDVKAWNEVMEDTLRTMRLPTRGDIDEIHEALYNLNKRVDYLIKFIENGGSRRRQPK